MLENEKLFIPGFHVWKQLVITSAWGARWNESRWNFVVRAFRCLSITQPTYWPDHVLLKYGLEGCDVLLNAELAADLIWRAVEFYPAALVSQGLESSAGHPSLHVGSQFRRVQVPLQDITKAMMICLSANDMVSCSKILSCVERKGLAASNMRSLYLLSLKGYANVGDTNSAEKLIKKMNEKGIQPG